MKKHNYKLLWSLRDMTQAVNDIYQQDASDSNLELLEKASELVTKCGCYICCRIDESDNLVVDRVVDCIEDYKWYLQQQKNK